MTTDKYKVYTVYKLKNFGSKGDIKNTSYINSLYCNVVSKIRLRTHSAQINSSKDFCKILKKFINQFAQNFKNFPKFKKHLIKIKTKLIKCNKNLNNFI